MKQIKKNATLIIIFLVIANIMQGQEEKLNDTIVTKKVIDTKKEQILTLEWDDYFYKYKSIKNSKERTWYRLAPLEHIEADKGFLKIYGYVPKKYDLPDDKYNEFYKGLDNNLLHTIKLKVPKSKTFHYSRWGDIANTNKRYWRNAFSLITVPVKVRRQSGNVPRRTTSGLSNLGVNWDLGFKKWSWFYISGKKNSIRISGGFLLAPSVEKVKVSERRNALEDATDLNQLFLSFGTTLSLVINDITFVFVPVGFDFATDSTGKSWVFNQKRWWGFGIGIETKSLGAVFSK